MYQWYCWWKQSQTTTWDVQSLANNGINMDKTSTGAGFQPSTVAAYSPLFWCGFNLAPSPPVQWKHTTNLDVTTVQHMNFRNQAAAEIGRIQASLTLTGLGDDMIPTSKGLEVPRRWDFQSFSEGKNLGFANPELRAAISSQSFSCLPSDKSKTTKEAQSMVGLGPNSSVASQSDSWWFVRELFWWNITLENTRCLKGFQHPISTYTAPSHYQSIAWTNKTATYH